MSQALKTAIEKNNPAAAKEAIEGIKNLGKAMWGRTTPLMLAAQNDADQVLPILLDAGAMSKADSIFEHPFGIAAMKGRREFMKVLADRKAVSSEIVVDTLRYVGRKGPFDSLLFILEELKPPLDATTIRIVSYAGDPAVVHAMKKAGANFNATEDLDDRPKSTPLHGLVDTCNARLVAALVECGADVNARDGIGRTPLMRLANYLSEQERMGGPERPVETLSLLLKLGADAKAKDRNGHDALDHYRAEAKRRKNAENPRVIELLSGGGATGDDATLSLFPDEPGDVKTVKAAIAAGADVNRQGAQHPNPTPLGYAAMRGDLEIVDLLLKAGADVNKFDRTMTPLIHASEQGHLAIVQLLVGAGADLNARELGDRADDCPAMNALEAAELNDHKPVIKYLKSKGATHAVHLLEAGVRTWDDFVEMLIKGDVATVTAAIAKQIGGKVISDACGKSFMPGKNAYVVAQPKGMAWCNVPLQLSPVLKGFADIDELFKFCAPHWPNASGLSAMWAAYGDTSAEADMMRFDASGKSSGLPKADDDESTTGERLDQFAKKEKMVIAAFNLIGAAKKKVEIYFPGHPAEIFEAVAYVSN